MLKSINLNLIIYLNVLTYNLEIIMDHNLDLIFILISNLVFMLDFTFLIIFIYIL